jgi:hypothetical protein
MYAVKLFNNLAHCCCGEGLHKELMTIFVFSRLEDAEIFYNQNKDKYPAEENTLGQYLAKPEKENHI